MRDASFLPHRGVFLDCLFSMHNVNSCMPLQELRCVRLVSPTPLHSGPSVSSNQARKSYREERPRNVVIITYVLFFPDKIRMSAFNGSV